MLQPQQVTAFPAEHMVTIVHFGLRPNVSKHHIRVCACLAAQFAFFSRADSGVLLTVINAQVSHSTPINQTAKNVVHNQAAPDSRVSSAQDDPASLSKNSGIITEWLLLLLVELDIPTPPGVKWTGHSLCRGGASAAHAIGVWKSLVSALLYIDVSVRPTSEALSFFGHLLTRFNLLQAPLVRQDPPTTVSSSFDLSDAFEELFEFDD
jgi:hypothetical protein